MNKKTLLVADSDPSDLKFLRFNVSVSCLDSIPKGAEMTNTAFLPSPVLFCSTPYSIYGKQIDTSNNI